MEYTPLTIYRGQPSSNNCVIYTVPNNNFFVLKNVVVVNETDYASTALIYIEKDGVLSNSIPPIEISGKANESFNMNIVLNEREKIVVKQTLDSTLTLSITGTRIAKTLPQLFSRALIAVNWDDAKYGYSNWSQFATAYTTWDNMPKRTWQEIKEMVGYWEYLKSTIM